MALREPERFVVKPQREGGGEEGAKGGGGGGGGGELIAHVCTLQSLH